MTPSRAGTMPAADTATADFSARARSFAAIHAGSALAPFAGNLAADVALLESGALALPATITDGGRGNAWVCSPRTTYADYAAEEAARHLPTALARPVQWLCGGLGHWLDAARFDRVVTINNWLLSTNLYPALDHAALADILGQARARWPGHAICFRSLNPVDNADWMQALEARGFRFIASRQVYLFDDVPALRARHVNLRRDLARLERSTLQRARDADIDGHDYARIAELYALLHLDKHSRFNPSYRPEFMRRWHRAGLLEFDGLRGADGRLQAVVGLFRQSDTLTAPIVGYDTALPQSLGLYRQATACIFQAMLRHRARLNLSAGAAGFKRLRGGQPVIEYSAMLAAHLPARTRGTLGALSFLTRRVGVPLMRRYRL